MERTRISSSTCVCHCMCVCVLCSSILVGKGETEIWSHIRKELRAPVYLGGDRKNVEWQTNNNKNKEFGHSTPVWPLIY